MNRTLIVARMLPGAQDKVAHILAEAFVTFDDIQTILVTKVGLAPQALEESPDSSLEDLGLDSLAVLELGIVINKQYGVEIPEESAGLKVDDIVGFINESARKAA